MIAFSFKKVAALAAALFLASAPVLSSQVPASEAPAQAESPSTDPVSFVKTRVTGLKAVSGESGVSLSWDPVPGAYGYIIGGICNGNPYAQLGWTTSAAYLDQKASLTEYSFYWVFPFIRFNNRNVRGQISASYVYGVRTLPAVSGLAAKPGYNEVQLSWNAVESADGYTLKIKRGANPVETVSDITATAWTDTAALSDALNFYWVYPYLYSGSAKRPGALGQYVYAQPLTVTLEDAQAADAAWFLIEENFYSRQGTVDYLRSQHHFSDEAISYALAQANADWNEIALKKASELLQSFPCSKEFLRYRLSQHFAFTAEEAAYAVDHVGADWKEQALLYLQIALRDNPNVKFTRLELLGALTIVPLFTEEEALYALDTVGITE